MRNAASGAFNGEKVTFLLSAAMTAWGLYVLVATGPIPLTPTQPIAYGQTKPTAALVSPIPERFPEDWYVVDGKVSGLSDPRTNQPVNRTRISPFEPFATPAITGASKSASVTPLVVSPPGPNPNSATDDKQNWDAANAIAKVRYMGVMTMDNGETFGLLKQKGNGPVMRVKVGSKIEAGGESYTVTTIERQAILIADSHQRVYMLKDSLFELANDAEEDAPPTAPRRKELARKVSH